MGQSQACCLTDSHVEDVDEQLALHTQRGAHLLMEESYVAEGNTAIEPLPSLLRSKGPVLAESTDLEIKSGRSTGGSIEPTHLEGDSKRPAHIEADLPQPVYNDSVPGPLRYGPRELRHMQAMGLIPKADSPQIAGDGAASGNAIAVQSADVAKDEADARVASKAQRRKSRRAQKQAEKLDASLKVRAFLDRHGFETVKSKKRYLFRTSYPLHAAVRENDVEVAALLLKAGASYRKPDSSGRSPLALAQYLNTRAGSHSEMIAILQGAQSVVAMRTSASSASSSSRLGA